MNKEILFAAAFALVFAPFVSASHLILKEPISRTVSSAQEITDLGVVGPGQKIELVLERESGEGSTTSAYEKEALWDNVFVVKDSLPPGWSAEDGKYYESPLHVFVKVAKNAADGGYFFKVRTYDEYEGVKPLEVSFKITVSRELLEATLSEKALETGVEQPGLYYLLLRNKSSASDAFEVTMTGLPSEAVVVKKVQVKHNSVEVVPFEVTEKERGEYRLSFSAKSLSSDSIKAGETGVLVVSSSLFNDMQAVSHGVLLFPSAEQSIYTFIGILAKLLS